MPGQTARQVLFTRGPDRYTVDRLCPTDLLHPIWCMSARRRRERMSFLHGPGRSMWSRDSLALEGICANSCSSYTCLYLDASVHRLKSTHRFRKRGSTDACTNISTALYTCLNILCNAQVFKCCSIHVCEHTVQLKCVHSWRKVNKILYIAPSKPTGIDVLLLLLHQFWLRAHFQVSININKYIIESETRTIFSGAHSCVDAQSSMVYRVICWDNIVA